MSEREARFAEAGRLAQMLVDIARQTMAGFAATVAEFGLPVHLARAVVLLTEPAPMRDLADQLDCGRSYIASLADQLEQRALVTRVTGEDRRVKQHTVGRRTGAERTNPVDWWPGPDGSWLICASANAAVDNPRFAQYQARTDRELPIIFLSRRAEG